MRRCDHTRLRISSSWLSPRCVEATTRSRQRWQSRCGLLKRRWGKQWRNRYGLQPRLLRRKPLCGVNQALVAQAASPRLSPSRSLTFRKMSPSRSLTFRKMGHKRARNLHPSSNRGILRNPLPPGALREFPFKISSTDRLGPLTAEIAHFRAVTGIEEEAVARAALERAGMTWIQPW